MRRNSRAVEDKALVANPKFKVGDRVTRSYNVYDSTPGSKLMHGTVTRVYSRKNTPPGDYPELYAVRWDEADVTETGDAYLPHGLEKAPTGRDAAKEDIMTGFKSLPPDTVLSVEDVCYNLALCTYGSPVSLPHVRMDLDALVVEGRLVAVEGGYKLAPTKEEGTC
jgi:hypothetical protein